MADFRLNVSADLFARVASCVSKDETRYHLKGVRCEASPDGGVIMVATNGHHLIAIRDPSGVVEDGGAIVWANRSTLTECGKKTPAKSPLLVRKRRFLVSGGRAAVVNEPQKDAAPLDYELCADPNHQVISYQWSDVIIDGQYPAWRRVLPNASGLEQAKSHVNISNLEKLARALTVKGNAPGVIVCGSGGEESPAWVFCPGSRHEIDGFGVIMPMRLSSPVLPKWAMSPVEGEKVAA